MPGAKIDVVAQQGLWMLNRVFSSGRGNAVEIELRGWDLAAADRIAADIRRRMERLAGITDARISRRGGQPEERLILDFVGWEEPPPLVGANQAGHWLFRWPADAQVRLHKCVKFLKREISNPGAKMGSEPFDRRQYDIAHPRGASSRSIQVKRHEGKAGSRYTGWYEMRPAHEDRAGFSSATFVDSR